jgi:hypothetical protein
MHFRRKPKLVYAYRWQDQPEIPAWLADAISRDAAYRYSPAGRAPQLMVRTAKGVVACHKGDWVIIADGALSVAEHSDFADAYELAANAIDWEAVAKEQSIRIQQLELALAEASNERDSLRCQLP